MIPLLNIRFIQYPDAEAVLEIYRPYIEETAITFEYDVPELNAWKNRIQKYTQKYPWLVAEWNHQIVGYAYATQHRDRIAYAWDTEVSVYVSEGFHGKGIARNLYKKLMDILRIQGFVNAYAIITSPNPKSEKFHENFGFTDVGRFHKSGYKFEQWFNTRWMQFHLMEHPIPPQNILSITEIQESQEIQKLLKEFS